MKKFKEFLKLKKKVLENKKKIPSIPVPIHFKHKKKKKLSEDTAVKTKTHYDWLEKNDNEHLSPKNDPKQISHILSKDHKVTKEQKRQIYDHTLDSSDLNGHLLETDNKPDHPEHKEKAEHLDKAIDSHPLPRELHTYSGLGFDPHKHMNEDGKMRSPAYISTTHDKKMALSFADKRDEGGGEYDHRRSDGGVKHIMHLHLRPGDPALHIEKYTHHDGEHETLIKRGVTLQHHGHEDYPSAHGGATVRVHRMSIAHD